MAKIDHEDCCKPGSGNLLSCPSCGSRSKAVKPITIESMLTDEARRRASRTDGFRFCPGQNCNVVYFHPDADERFGREDVCVRIGQKETEPPRPICYCFNHTIEEIEAEVAETGTSKIPDEITQKCRQGLGRCEKTNPQGSCCLGNVRKVVKEAQAGREGSTRGAPEKDSLETPARQSPPEPAGLADEKPSDKAASRLNAGALAQAGALITAIFASACCWLPLLLITFGVSGGALSATFATWRPVLLPLTFVLLGAAFYFTYRRPRVALAASGGTPGIAGAAGAACCSVPVEEAAGAACCPPHNARGFTIKKLSRAMLWIVAVFVLAFAFFPNYLGYVLGGGNALAARDDLDMLVVKVDGMTCEACVPPIESMLRAVPGVADADVSYERGEALVGIPRDTRAPRAQILAAFSKAGFTGRFVDQVQWDLKIDGMTCEACASHIEASLLKVPAVFVASVSYEDGQATLSADSTVGEEALKNSIRNAGYTVTRVERASTGKSQRD